MVAPYIEHSFTRVEWLLRRTNPGRAVDSDPTKPLTSPATSEVAHQDRTWSSVVEHSDSASPTPLGGPSMPGGYLVLPRRKAGRSIDITTADGLAALAGKCASGINAVVGSAQDLAGTPGSGPGRICPL